MGINEIKILKSACLFLTAAIVVGSNIFNYFYAYKTLGDINLQWRVAMIAISSSMFLMAAYLWLNESLKGTGIKIIITGWVALYLLFNFIGVCLGFTLHSKGFMSILFLTAFIGTSHLIIRLWQKLR